MTIINNSHRFIFVHIPKTAGTTLTVVFSSLTRWNDIELGGTEYGETIAPLYLKKFGLGKHTRLSQIQKIIGAEEFQKFRRFAFVRDPYSKIYSTYRHLKRWRAWKGSEIMESFGSFLEFVNSPFFLESTGPDNLFIPQFRWLVDENEKLLTDYIGRVETLLPSISTLIDKFSLPINVSILPMINESGDPSEYRTAYTSKAREIVIKKYKRDFELFAYSADDLNVE
jgi:Sulfotransferase family